jgi:hypothetical protein
MMYHRRQMVDGLVSLMTRCLEKDQVHRPTLTELQEQLQALAAWHAGSASVTSDLGYGPVATVTPGPAVDVAGYAPVAATGTTTPPARRVSLPPLVSP